MPFFTATDGVKLAYEVCGEGPCILFHLGAGCDAGLWRAAGYVEPLAPSYTCILFDHRGHGASDKPRGPEAFHIDRLTADVVELLDHLDIGVVAFWGYSAALSTGTRLAELHPERIWALIANGSVGPSSPPEVLAEWTTRRAAEFRELGWEKLISGFEVQEPKPIPGWMLERIRATDAEQYADMIESYRIWNWDEWDVLPEIQTPTLFLTGALEDADGHVEEIVGRMRDASVVKLPDVGHINAFLATDLVLERVRPFLQEHAPQSR